MNSVLLIESNTIDSAYTKLLLKRCGWDAKTVSNADSLKDLLSKDSFRVVILNDSTLGNEFEEVLCTTRQHAKSSNLPMTIIGTSNCSLRGIHKKLLNQGLDYCLAKPFYKNDLSQVLDDIIEPDMAELVALSS